MTLSDSANLCDSLGLLLVSHPTWAFSLQFRGYFFTAKLVQENDYKGKYWCVQHDRTFTHYTTFFKGRTERVIALQRGSWCNQRKSLAKHIFRLHIYVRGNDPSTLHIPNNHLFSLHSHHTLWKSIALFPRFTTNGFRRSPTRYSICNDCHNTLKITTGSRFSKPL